MTITACLGAEATSRFKSPTVVISSKVKVDPHFSSSTVIEQQLQKKADITVIVISLNLMLSVLRHVSLC